MTRKEQYPGERLHRIAEDVNYEARVVRNMRNIMVGMAALSEVTIGAIDIAGVNYPDASVYPIAGGLFMVAAGIAHLSARHWDHMAEDFREGARDVQVFDTYNNPQNWDKEMPK